MTSTAILLGLCVTSSASQAQAPALARHLDRYLATFVRTRNLSGTILVARNDTTLYAMSAGLADPAFGAPNQADTRFHIGSISKAFTGAAVLMLQDRGLLHTSDPVAKYLPDFPNGDRIRLDNLLVHNSGIPNVDPEPSMPAEYHAFTADEVVQLFRSKPLAFDPGTRFAYTNSDYNLLARVLEIVTGKSYGDVVDGLILEPLRLASTGHDGNSRRVVPRLALGTEPDGLTGVRLVPYAAWSLGVGSGSLYSTAGDLCRFAHAVFSGHLLSAGALNQLNAAHGVFPYGWTNRERGGRQVKASGGRMHGFIVNLEYSVDDGTCVAILTNSYSSVGQVVADDLGSIVAGRSAAPPPIAYVPPKRGSLSPFVGTYQLPPEYYAPNAIVLLRDHGDYLTADWSVGVTNVVYPVGGDDFIDRNNWAYVHFTRDGAGRVNGLTYRLLQDFIAKRLE